MSVPRIEWRPVRGSRQTVAVTELTTDGLVLRDFAVTDEADAHSYASDPIVTRFCDRGPNGIDETRAFLAAASAQANDPQRDQFALAAVQPESGRVVGSVSIGVTSAENRRGEISFVFHRDVWSQGYATRAARLLVRFGFAELRLRRVFATCHPDNHASARVLEKAGLDYEGRMRSHLFVRGEWRDSLLYAAVNPEA